MGHKRGAGEPAPQPAPGRPGLFFSPFITRPSERRFSLNYTFADVIKAQTYITFFGMTAVSEKDSVQDNYETGDDVDVTLNLDSERLCQTFTPSADIYCDEVQVRMSSTFSTSWPNHNAEIQTTSGGEPTGVKLGTYNLDENDNTNDAWVSGTGNRLRLKKDVVYALVIVPQNSSGGRALNYRADGSSPTYAGGSVGTSNDSGSTWTMDTGKDLFFRIIGGSANPYIIFPATGIISDAASTSIGSLESQAVDDILVDLDFDFEVQNTIGVKGLALLKITNSISTITGYIVANLIRFDGTTETTIATTTGRVTSGEQLLKLDITSLNSVKRGDTLRLNIQFKADSVSTGSASLNHSGNDLILYLPTKLVESL